MRRKVVLSAIAVLVTAILPPAAPSAVPHARITVRPAVGSPTTRFVVRFRAPRRSGLVGSLVRRYVVDATGPRGDGSCVSSISASPSRAFKAKALVNVTLSPTAAGIRWCSGAFHGRVQELETPACPKGRLCPAFVVVIGTVGRFSFRVRAPADATPPSFAGLGRAFACTPGAQRPGQTTPFTLSWSAATDNVTPSAQLVYDVFEADQAGHENFSIPTWTTAAGATTFRTPGLPSHGTYYFVVRARDQAGNEDQNRVERRGVDPCR